MEKYIAFWFSQSVSQLGSSMTGFALILWAYQKSGSAMSVSMMTLFSFLPYVIISLFSGSFADRYDKKKIILLADTAAAAVCFMITYSVMNNSLELFHIYAANFIIGCVNAFQRPASSAAIGAIAPKDKIDQICGMNAFSDNIIMVSAPVLSAAFFGFGGLKLVLITDLVSFFAAALILLLFVTIPKTENQNKKTTIFSDCAEGFAYLKDKQDICLMIATIAVMNFFSRLTYENILSPMLLARSGNNAAAVGMVNAFMGIGGIIGGVIVSLGKGVKNRRKSIYLSAMLSFLLGDVLMAVSKTTVFWSIAAFAASFPIPFINAAQNSLFYARVPKDMQGRIFAVKNAASFCIVAPAVILGGYLADNIFEPMMKTTLPIANAVSLITGGGNGSGMAAMFLLTGTLGSLFCLLCYNLKMTRMIDDPVLEENL